MRFKRLAVLMVAVLPMAAAPAAAEWVSLRVSGVTPRSNPDAGGGPGDFADPYVRFRIVPASGPARVVRTDVVENVPPGVPTLQGVELETVQVGSGPLTIEWQVNDKDGFLQFDDPMGGESFTLPCDGQPRVSERFSLDGSGATASVSGRCSRTRFNPGGGTSLSLARDLRIKLEALSVDHENETSDDEPYFVVIGFRSRVGTPGSTRVYWSEYLGEMEIEEREHHTFQPIPIFMGELRIHDIRPLVLSRPVDPANLAGLGPEIFGAVVLSMEHDATVFWAEHPITGELLPGSVTGIMRFLVDRIEREIRQLVENATSFPRRDAIDGAIERVVEAMTDYADDNAAGIALASDFDVDSFIGFHTFVLASVISTLPEIDVRSFLPESNELVTFGLLQEPPRTTIRFNGNGVPQRIRDLTWERAITAYDVTVELSDTGRNRFDSIIVEGGAFSHPAPFPVE